MIDVQFSLSIMTHLLGTPNQLEINSILVPNPQKSKSTRISADISSPTGLTLNTHEFQKNKIRL